MGQNIDPVRALVGSDQLDNLVRGFEYLGGGLAGSAVTSLPVFSFAQKDVLLILGRIVSLSSADVVALRFGVTAGAVDSTATYWDRNMIGPAGNGLFFNASNASTTMWRLSYYATGGLSPDTGGTTSRVFFVTISNPGSRSKVGTWNQARSTGSAATIGQHFVGMGEYVNTTAPIQAMQLFTQLGTATMGVGSGFCVFGKDV